MSGDHQYQDTRRTADAPTSAAVVVGVDGSDGAITAVRWAAVHARDIGAQLRLVYAASAPASTTVALPVPVSITGATPRRRRARPGKRVLALAASEVGMYASAVEVSGRLVPSGAVDALLKESVGAGLLVVGSRGMSRVSATLVGSVGVQVAAQACCPTVVVRSGGTPDGPVVVAVDGSETSEPALRFAFAEAARRRSGLVAVHAWTPPVIPVGAGHAVVHAMTAGAARTELHRAAERELTDAISPWRSAFPHVDIGQLVLEGNPESVLPETTAGAALAVVGSRGRGRLAGLPMGSTSHAVLAGATCPVAVVRETGEARN
jgi:nucleotide-binding universal stress UspA family protein